MDWNEVNDNTQKISELEQELEDERQKLSELKTNTFGVDSEEAEEKAKLLFKKAGTGEGSENTDQIEKAKKRIQDTEETIEDLQENIQQKLTEIKFPFNETIDQKNGSVVFPFADELPQETVDFIQGIIQNGEEKSSVDLQTDSIVVEKEDVNEAIDAVDDFTDEIRSCAQHELNTDEYASKLANRDIKIKRMLYELYENDEPLAKKDLELATGVGKGGLRGVLYHVHDEDPYLVKENKKYRLSDIGRTVVEKFLDEHGVPEKPNQDGEASEEQDPGVDQETISPGGDSNE
jgi:hypothetical protein